MPDNQGASSADGEGVWAPADPATAARLGLGGEDGGLSGWPGSREGAIWGELRGRHDRETEEGSGHFFGGFFPLWSLLRGALDLDDLMVSVIPARQREEGGREGQGDE